MKESANSPETESTKEHLSQLAKKATDRWGKERAENEPKIAIKMLFSDHVEGKDVEAAVNNYTECDIFIPENSTWTAEEEELWNSVSLGNTKPEQFIGRFNDPTHPEFLLAELYMVYNSKKQIMFIDLPSDHPLHQRLAEANEKYTAALIGSTFKEVLQATKAYLSAESDFHQKREEYMVETLPKRIHSFLVKNPEFKKREKLKVLISLGNAHTPMFLKMKDEGKDVTREFRDLPYIFSVHSEILRALAFGKEPTNDMIARYIFGKVIPFLFSSELEKLEEEKGRAKVLSIFNSFLRGFNCQEIEKLLGSGYNKDELKKRLKEEYLKKHPLAPEFFN